MHHIGALAHVPHCETPSLNANENHYHLAVSPTERLGARSLDANEYHSHYGLACPFRIVKRYPIMRNRGAFS